MKINSVAVNLIHSAGSEILRFAQDDTRDAFRDG